MTWEKIVRMVLARRRMRDLHLRRIGVSRKTATVAFEELGGKLPGLGFGAEKFGPVEIVAQEYLRMVDRIRFSDSVLVRVFGSGVLEMNVSAEKDVVFVISGDRA